MSPMGEHIAVFECPICKRTTEQSAALEGQVSCNSDRHLPRKIAVMRVVKRRR